MSRADHRVVSLIASATELVSALGCQNRLVGRSHECDYPPEVANLPECSQPRIDVDGTSRQIDERVKATVADAFSVYRVHTDVLNQLQPTLIITQTQCEVCAVSLKDVERAVCDLVGSQPQIIALEPMELADLWKDLRIVGRALRVDDRAETLVRELQSRLSALKAETGSLPSPSVGCIEWIDPPMMAGNWVPELVEIAGGRDLFGTAGEHSGYIEWPEIVAADPEVIAVMPCGFDIARSRREMRFLIERPEWNQLQAVRNDQVYLTDGNQYFNRPGPRLVESAEILAEVLHPGRFSFGHEGTGWVRWTNE